jgi:hypothetical protein
VENGEDEEAASHQRSQHSEELLEVDVIVRTAGRRQREREGLFSRAEAVYFRSCYNTA